MMLPTCTTCYGNNILLDAWAEYDPVTKDWVLKQTFDSSYCEDCEGECSMSYTECEDNENSI
jgi:hypothetical protein